MHSYSVYATVLGKFNEGLFLELLTLKQSSHYIAAVADGFVGEVNKHLLALLAYMSFIYTCNMEVSHFGELESICTIETHSRAQIICPI